MSDNNELRRRITGALQVAKDYGTVDGGHHKMWVIDQMVRHLTGCPMMELQSRFPDAHGNAYTYQGLGESGEYGAFVGDEEWDEGIAP